MTAINHATIEEEGPYMMATAVENLTAIEQLQELLQAGQVRAALNGGAILVSYSRPVAAVEALDFFGQAQSMYTAAFFWEQAEEHFTLTGGGEALVLEATGAERFDNIERRWQALQGQAIISSLETGRPWGSGPILLGGFAFDAATLAGGQWPGYPDGRMALPEIMLTVRQTSTYLTFNALVEPDTDCEALATRMERQALQLCQPLALPEITAADSLPSTLKIKDVLLAASWQKLVAGAVTAIKTGHFQKVVLARAVRAQAVNTISITTALARLRHNYPGATLFALAQGEHCFLGATPERLVRLCEGEIRTIGLAGSAPRGRDEAEDIRLGQELLDSSKNRHEHAIVVRMLRQALEGICSRIWADEAPQLLKLSNVQHLYTPVLGHLTAPASVLKLVERLHPTPALGGYPRQEALTWLRHNEDLDRGWYAAPVGWVDSRGEGEFVAGIRSALVHGRQATLYAGCGIVAASDPTSEYAESCLKLKPMLTALA